jgi:parallel beta-helix repeat protein
MSSSLPFPLQRRSIALITTMAITFAGAFSAAAPNPVEAACGSFQNRVNNAKAGSTITIPKCTYHGQVTVSKPLAINAYGVTINAGGAQHGLLIQANDVTVKGVTVKNASGGSHHGAIQVNGSNRFTLRGAKVKDSATVCLTLNGGSGHRIYKSHLTGCGKEGYFGNGISNTKFINNWIHHNNTNLAYDPQVEAGGGKIMASSGITFAWNKVWANGGPGIWFDNGVKNVVVKQNRVWNNHESGIMFEISNGAEIYGNKVWGNGFGHAAWGFGAGILISSSDNAKMRYNTVAWNARGISVISQNRPTKPHKGNVIRDNVVISKSGAFVTGFYDDHGGSLFTTGNGNRGHDNRYWIGQGQPTNDRFHWNGPRTTMQAYNATRGEERGKYISKAKRNEILRAKKMPIK